MRGLIGRKRYVGLTAVGAVAALVFVPLALAGAINTTADSGQTVNNTSTGACLQGPDPSTNCNIYQQMEDVFLSGSPVQASLGAGTYYFAVLDPGGQPNPNPGAPDLLSNDGAIQREFSLNDAGVVTNLGDHVFDSGNNRLSVFPYDNTSNPGGEYSLAVCKISADESTVAIDPVPTVKASDCKYDNFKVKASETSAASGPTISKDAAGSYTTTFAWGISKSASPLKVRQIGGNASFTYTVQVTHDGGSPTPGSVKVKGTISVFNPNVDGLNDTVPLSITGVTDSLSDNTTCSVTDGGARTLTTYQTDFAYECDLSALPSGSLDNTATVTWPTQTINGATLTGDHASFTFTGISFSDDTQNDVDSCTTVTDTLPSAASTSDTPFPATVCVGQAGPPADGGAGTDPGDGFTFVYHVSYPVPTNDCTSYTNYADESADGNEAQATVQVCGPARTGALTIGFWKNSNGQSLIKSYCINGSNTLGAYLAGLGAGSGPFSNAPTSCSSLANSVSTILAGASASNMNSMLRAQMLGTALDVWFSGPGWVAAGSGKTKTPGNFLSHNTLGAFNMDTTSICPMIDNTTAGTATCGGGKPSTDAVATGAVPTSPMSMQAILGYAATTSTPFNGSTSSPIWYGGNRTLEEVLKNIFDQFNNGDAFGSF